MLNRIKALREDKGLSQTELGNAVEPPVHWQTIQRLESGKSPLTPAWMERLAKALEISDPLDFLVRRPGVRLVPVLGVIQAGHWTESWEVPAEDRESVPIPDDEALKKTQLYGATTRGPSMNKRYPEGTLIIFTDYAERPEALKEGRRYVVERERADGLHEATVKTLWRDERGKLWLLPESTDPRFQEPIPIDGGEDDIVRIRGRVVYAVQRED